MARAEVVISGVGLVTPLGADADSTARAWRDGAPLPRRRWEELAGTAYAHAEHAFVPESSDARAVGGRMTKFMSHAALLGCMAARAAAQDAAVQRRFAPERVGLFAGSGLAAADVAEVLPMLRASIGPDGHFSCRLFGERGLAATNPVLSFKILSNMPPCFVSINETIKGANCIFTPWEGQTAYALLEAWDAVAEGEVDCAFAGAADDPTNPATFIYLVQQGLLGAGEIPAPAAAYLILERRSSAERDGRTPRARIVRMETAAAASAAGDGLAPRMGRAFAAAPAVLLALGALGLFAQGRSCGADGREFRFELEHLPCNASR